MSEPTAQALSHQLASQLAAFVPAHFSSRLNHACTRFSDAAEDCVPDEQHPAKILIEYIAAEKVAAEQLAKFWLCSEFALDSCCANSAVLLELIDSGDLDRNYHLDIASSTASDSASHSDRSQSVVYSAALETRLRQANTDADPLADEDVLSVLRRTRQREMLRIIWRDLNRLGSLEETTLDLSLLASACVDAALNYLHKQLVKKHGEPLGDASQSPQRLVVLGMGKLGAYELNLSSDIDLIFAYAESGETSDQKNAISNHEFFTRLGKELIRFIDSRTVDGFVFRVDMRLRPNGESGPLVLNFTAIENYYQQHGREWERYAMVKARAVAGDIESGQQLLSTLRPFVYRRYLDFGAIDALRDMKKLIEQQVKRQNLAQDIKLGAGGIREVEFIVQSFQLIHGGRIVDFQQANLLKMLPILEAANCLSSEQLNKLSAAYRFLRDTEHALQGWRDEQTQKLPMDPDAQQRLAFAMGFGLEDSPQNNSVDEYLFSLNQHRENVRYLFSGIVTSDEADAADESAEESESLEFWRWLWLSDDLNISNDKSCETNNGEVDAIYKESLKAVDAESLRLLNEFKGSRRLLVIENLGRDRLDKLMPMLLSLCAEAEQPSLALKRVFPFLDSVLRRTAYLALLLENPKALKQLVSLCQTSPWVAEQLASYPSLLDELLDHRNLYTVPSGEQLADELRQQLLRIENNDLEVAMDVLRHFKLAHGLRVAACQISGVLPLMKISDYLSFLAEVILQAVLEFAWNEMEAKYGAPKIADANANINARNGGGQSFANSENFIIVGYGKLGGIELGPASDLDLVFIHDTDSQAETLAGPKQKAIANSVFFNRLGQRVIHILTAQTVSGALYEVDMRLRPSGASGLLVSSFDAFERYQRESAWTWEHQALVRARAVAGDSRLSQRFTELRKDLLCESRSISTLRNDVIEMRNKMREHLDNKPVGQDKSADQHFNIKQSRGGIVDIEFLVQFCVLANAGAFPSLARWTDNIRILESLAEVEIISAQESEQLIQAYQDYRAAAHLDALKQQKEQQSSAESQQVFASHRQNVEKVWARFLNVE